jgi:hypothetical protein
MAAVENWHDRIIEEFRVNEGNVGGPSRQCRGRDVLEGGAA